MTVRLRQPIIYQELLDLYADFDVLRTPDDLAESAFEIACSLYSLHGLETLYAIIGAGA